MNNMKNGLLLTILINFIFSSSLYTQEKNDLKWPRKVLITNDDGIDDEKMIAMANAFSKIAETYVIAPNNDRSGSSHYASVFSKHYLTVEKIDTNNSMSIYKVDGYPADCIFLALKGIMKDNPPDLVISGINEGPNLGFDWMASGTIGAARMSAYWGVPAIAVSGFKGDNKEDLNKVIEWIVTLSQSNLVKNLRPNQYLTVSFPPITSEQTKGIKIVKRDDILLEFEMAITNSESNIETWRIMQPKPIFDFLPESDAAFYYQNYIVIVPMVANEIDYDLLKEIENSNKIPKWINDSQQK